MNTRLPTALLAGIVMFSLSAVAVAGKAFAVSLSPRPSPRRGEGTDGSHTDTELTYAEGLFQLGLPDFADMVLDRLEATDAPAVRVRRFRFRLSSKRHLAWAEKEIAKAPADARETWHMKLALADAYYAFGQHDKAFAIYGQFMRHFSKTESPEDADLLATTTYRYAQMLRLTGRIERSLNVYKSIPVKKMQRHVRRQVLAEQAELMIRICEKGDKSVRSKYLPAAEKICDNLMFITDLWGGRAIVMKAHVRLLQGQPKKAREILEDSLPLLAELDRRLRE